MIRLRGLANELRRARDGVGALGMTALLVAGSATAEEAPGAAAPTAAPKAAQGPTMKPVGGPPGPAAGHGVAPGQRDKSGPGDKAGRDDKGPKSDDKGEKGHGSDAAGHADAPKGPLSPAERASLALERAKERLEQAAKQVQSEEGEPDPKTRAQRRAARRAFLRAQHDLRKASGKKFELTAEQKTALKEKYEKKAHDQEASRPKRMTDSQAKVKRSYGQALGHPPIRRELRRHAWRIARLERTRALAEIADQKELLERATLLTTAENSRHEKRMKQLMDMWKKAGSPKGVLPSAAKKEAAVAAPAAPAPGAPAATAPPKAPAPAPKAPAPAAPTPAPASEAK